MYYTPSPYPPLCDHGMRKYSFLYKWRFDSWFSQITNVKGVNEMGIHIAKEYLAKYGEFAIDMDSRIDQLNTKTIQWSNYNTRINKNKPSIKATHILNYLYDLNHVIEVPHDILKEISEIYAFVKEHEDEDIPSLI